MSVQTPDFAAMRRNMVDCQVRPADVTDLRIIDAMMSVPRESFLPQAQRGMAYLDLDIGIGEGAGRRYLLKPALIARMMQAAGLEATHRLLVVGCPTGYVAAVAARIAREVTVVECDTGLAAQSRAALAGGGCGNVDVETGDLIAGCPARAPFDVIFVAGGSEIVPEALCSQLTPNGCLVGVFGPVPMRAMLIRHSHDGFGSRVLFDAAAPILPGFSRPAAFVF